jgi:hypothetical protein
LVVVHVNVLLQEGALGSILHTSGLAERVPDRGEHDELVKLPLSTDAVQVLVSASDAQVLGDTAKELEYAVTLDPVVIVPPHGRVQLDEVTVQDEFVYDPTNVPFEHDRDSDIHVAGDITDADWYAVTEAP